MITTLIFLGQFAFAQVGFADEEKSAFERSLEQDTSVTSEESWVKIKDTRYRKFEFNGGRYYVVFRGDGTTLADVYCAPPEGSASEHLIEQPSEGFRRNSAFVRAFNEACTKAHGNQRTDLHITPEMGLAFTEGKGQKVFRKKKKP